MLINTTGVQANVKPPSLARSTKKASLNRKVDPSVKTISQLI
jgi:hypothetical protein